MEPDERRRQELRLEARAMLEEAEAEAALLDAATTTMREALIDIGKQGRTVAVELNGPAAGEVSERIGQIVHVGAEVVLVRTDVGADVLVSTDGFGSVRVLDGPLVPTAISTGYPDTLDARLRAAAQVGEVCTLGRRAHGAVAGVVIGLTPTHVELQNVRGERVLVPRTVVVWVRVS